MRKFRNCSNPLIWFLGVVVTAFLAGCGSSGGGGTPQAGVLGVSMTDAPACGYDQVNVTVSKVRVHQSDSANDNAAGWADITLNSPKKINLLDLKDALVLETLGETSLAAGHYTQLRLVLVPNSQSEPLNNSVVPSGTTTEIALVTPSAVQSGVKLIHQFTVDPGQRVDLLLDFDACKSIVQTGNGKYILKPVIKVIPFVLNGIEGFVDTSLLGSNVVVSAQVNGEIVRATVPNITNTPALLGKFFLARLPDGVNYDIVITADSHSTAVISGVPVPTSTSITVVSTPTSPVPPITLQPSATGSIDGTVTLQSGTDEETVFVAAKQIFGSGPTVTVQSQVATVVTGNPPGDYSYALTLPTAAPLLGPYALPLPIVFAPQAAVANKYAVQASATGYITGLAPDLPTGVTQIFNLNLAP